MLLALLNRFGAALIGFEVNRINRAVARVEKGTEILEKTRVGRREALAQARKAYYDMEAKTNRELRRIDTEIEKSRNFATNLKRLFSAN